MNDKPIIRHCRNCKYAELHTTGEVFCDVKYNLHLEGFQRADAIFCKYYKQKEQTPEFLTKRVNLPEAKQKSAIENLAKACEEFVKNIGG